MLKIEKLVKLFEATRCKGNTTHLLESVQGTNVDLLVYSESFRKSLYQDGYTNVTTPDNVCTKRAFVLDNSVVHDAINEALEYIKELEDKFKKYEVKAVTINTNATPEQIAALLMNSSLSLKDILKY